MREIGVLTTSRADFGIYQPVLERMKRSRRLKARIIASGSHLDPRFGRTVSEIEGEGYPVFRRVSCLEGDMAAGMGRMLSGMGKLFRSWRPDLLLVLGDRFEMLAGALASVPFQIPIAHLHGGEVTAGALDDTFRHVLSTLAHLHFAATEEAGCRLRATGEEAWRIVVSGAPALDRLNSFKPQPMSLPEEFILVTFHPATREPGREGAQASALIRALERLDRPCVVTAPNADPGNQDIRRRLREFCRRHPRSRFLESAGARGYFTLMSRASAMIGNSSSGILEAASFLLPVVNIGARQEGRQRAANVIDCDAVEAEILRAARRALSPAFRRSLRGLKNPYGDGRASERIVRRLEAVALDSRLLRKEAPSP